jgi:hypothetical protein
MAYDEAAGNAVLFGGVNRANKFLNSTWTWDGTTWTQQHPATIPPAREFASMAYDAVAGNAVLFGGDRDPKAPSLGDTWTWGSG